MTLLSNPDKIAVIYLHREHGCTDAFENSYHQFKAGAAHDLISIYPGHPADGKSSLRAFRWAALNVPHRWICFLNSWSQIRCDDWLAKLFEAVRLPGVGIAGCSASYETFNGPGARLFFPPFPNPHIRTTGFMMRTWLAAALFPRWPFWHKKLEQAAESGWFGLTRRLLANGYDAVTVDKNGNTFMPCAWPSSGLYRGCFQDGLIISDNQTRAYDLRDSDGRHRLRAAAWQGATASDSLCDC